MFTSDNLHFSKEHLDKHEKCGKQLKLYEQYIIELECRLKEFLNFVFIDNRSDHRQIVVRRRCFNYIFYSHVRSKNVMFYLTSRIVCSCTHRKKFDYRRQY